MYNDCNENNVNYIDVSIDYNEMLNLVSKSLDGIDEYMDYGMMEDNGYYSY